MGLALCEADIEWVKDCATAEGATRSSISRALCRRKEWNDFQGRPREVAARVLLNRLDRGSVISLPAPCAPIPRRVPVPAESEGAEQLEGVVTAVERVRTEVVESEADRKQWREIMERHHYLGAGPICGRQLWYLVRCEHEVIGGLAFSASAYSLAARDRWIGWSEAARRENLQYVVCNSRFLLVPKVPNLASHLLSKVCTRLSEDWRRRYGFSPLLVETFVDKERFSGSCYRAANWHYLGETSGRGRNDSQHKSEVSIKQVFAYPLAPHWYWQKELCREPVKVLNDAEPWASHEFGAVDLGDERLTRRLMGVAQDFFAKPTADIPEACGNRAKTKAVYRLCSNPAATMENLLSSHYEATLSRCSQEARVFAIQDTTSLNYTMHPATTDLGPVGTFGAQPTQGLYLHSTFMLNEAGTPLGLLNVQCWARDNDESRDDHAVDHHDLPIEEKESYKWLRGFQATCEAGKRAPSTQFVVMGDREADIFELFEAKEKAPENVHLVIRAQYPRNIATTTGEKASLWEHVAGTLCSGEIIVSVPRRGNRKARTAQLELRFAHVKIQVPDKNNRRRHTKRREPVTLWAIAATEPCPPEGVEPISWLLLSTLPVTTFEQAREKVCWYTQRWQVEVFHRTLKSGCRIENRQLASAHSLKACLALDLVVAWRIFNLAKLGRECSDFPCSVFFEEHEWKALVCFTKKTSAPPQEPPSLKDAVIMVATLGGFLGRKRDGMPGTQTLWRGLERLSDIAATFVIFFNSA